MKTATQTIQARSTENSLRRARNPFAPTRSPSPQNRLNAPGNNCFAPSTRQRQTVAYSKSRKSFLPHQDLISSTPEAQKAKDKSASPGSFNPS